LFYLGIFGFVFYKKLNELLNHFCRVHSSLTPTVAG
jgi:hypothetical protein